MRVEIAGTRVAKDPTRYAREHLKIPSPSLEMANSQASWAYSVHVSLHWRSLDWPAVDTCSPPSSRLPPSRGDDSVGVATLSLSRCDASRNVKLRFRRSPVMGDMKEALRSLRSKNRPRGRSVFGPLEGDPLIVAALHPSKDVAELSHGRSCPAHDAIELRRLGHCGQEAGCQCLSLTGLPIPVWLWLDPVSLCGGACT